MPDSIRKASIADFAAGTITTALGVSSNILIARFLGPEAKGLFSLFLTTQALILVPASAIQTSITHHIAKLRVQWDPVRILIAQIAVVQGIISVSLLFILYQFQSARQFLFGSLPAQYLLFILVVTGFTLWMFYRQGILSGVQVFVKQSIIGTVTQVLSLTITFVYIGISLLQGKHITVFGMVSVYTANVVIGAVLWRVFVPRIDLADYSEVTSSTLLRSILAYAGPVFLRNSVEWANYRVDVYFVNAFAGSAQLGLYTVAVGLAQQMWIVPYSMSGPLFSRVSADGKQEGSRDVTGYAFRLTLLFSLLMGLCVAVAGPLLIPLVYGGRFRGASTMLLYLLPGVIAIGPSSPIAAYLAGVGSPIDGMRAHVVGLVFTVGLDLLLVPRWGGQGAALASSASYIAYTMTLCRFYFIRSGETWRGLLFVTRSDVDRVLGMLSDVRTFVARR